MIMIDNNVLELIELFIKNNNEDDLMARKAITTGILQNLILSRQLFKRNKEIGEFLKNCFDTELSEYMLHSRTMICGKVSRIIYSIDEEELNNFMSRLYEILIKVAKEDDVKKIDIYDVIRKIEL